MSVMQHLSSSSKWREKLVHGLQINQEIVKKSWNQAEGIEIDFLNNILAWFEGRKSISEEDQPYLLKVKWKDFVIGAKSYFPNFPQGDKIYNDSYSTYDNDIERWNRAVIVILKTEISKLKNVSGSSTPASTCATNIDDESANSIEVSDATSTDNLLRRKVFNLERTSVNGFSTPASTCATNIDDESANSIEVSNATSIDNLLRRKVSNLDSIGAGQSPVFIETLAMGSLQHDLSTHSVLQVYGGQGTGKSSCLWSLMKLHDTATVTWNVQCASHESVVEDSFRSLLKNLEVEYHIHAADKSAIMRETNVALAVLKYLAERNKSTVISFDTVEPMSEAAKDDVDVIRDLINEVLRSRDICTVKLIVATSSITFLSPAGKFSEFRSFVCRELEMYTDSEAIDYMTSRPHELGNDDERDKLLRREDAKLLVSYFNNNPLCLKVARYYCMTHKLSYNDYLDVIQCQGTRQRVVQSGARMLLGEEKSSKLTYYVMNKVREADKRDDDRVALFKDVLKALTLVSHENISMLLIGRLFQVMRKPQEGVKEEGARMKLDTMEFVDWLRVYGLISTDRAIWPGGFISLRKHQLDAQESEHHSCQILRVVLAALVGLISKDNRQRPDDLMLLKLRPHIRELSKHAELIFKASQDEAPDLTVMQLCRLQELYGQALIQGRVPGMWKDALQALEDAAGFVWDIVCALNQSNWLACLCFDESANREKVYYDENNDPEVVGASLAELCVKAGGRAEFVDDYLLTSLVLNKSNVEEFLERIVQLQKVSRKKAELLLDDVIKAVESKLPVDSGMLAVLRDNRLFLSKKEMQKVFLSERLASIYHLYGRQVLYLQSEMPPWQQKKCEHCRELAYHICRTTRELTGIGLLYEYIAVANSRVPRMLQNKPDEDIAARKTRLELAYKESRALLDPTGDLFESGMYKLVEGTMYTRLNAYKYMLKSHNKKMKDVPRTQRFRERALGAFDDCKMVLEIAESDMKLDMAPHCVIQAAKFYASVGKFVEAFQAFEIAFGSEALRGLKTRRPNSFAWAVDNYARAVRVYEERDAAEKQASARSMCKDVVSLKIGASWKKKMEDWMERLK